MRERERKEVAKGETMVATATTTTAAAEGVASTVPLTSRTSENMEWSTRLK